MGGGAELLLAAGPLDGIGVTATDPTTVGSSALSSALCAGWFTP